MDDVSKAVARLAAKDPERPAVIDEVTFLTYSDLHERADRWAYALQNSGFTPGHEIMLLLPNRTEFVELLIASIRAEVIPLVLHGEFASNDIARLASGTKSETMITSREIAEKMSSELKTRLEVLCIEDFDLSFPLNGKASPSRVAADIVFFTSGTSGKPKGIVVPKSIFNIVMPSTVPRRRPKPHLLCRPLYFRAHLTAVCSILQEGNTVVLARRADPDLWMRLIERHQIPFVSLGPSDINRWLDILELKDVAFPASVKHMMSTGAPLSNSLKTRIKKLLPHVRITDLYGTSEVGAITMIDHDEWGSKTGSCGRPVFFSTVKIMDGKKEASIREVGEICVKSPYQMREYYNDVDTTIRTFEGDYIRTGDLGYFDDQGYLFLLGRINRVMNCSGFQVFPEEVENVLREGPNVKDAVVIGMKHQGRGQLPYAFVLIRQQSREDRDLEVGMAHALLAYCKRRLASYKVPAAIFFLDEIPLNSAGKTDYLELARRAAKQHEYG